MSRSFGRGSLLLLMEAQGAQGAEGAPDTTPNWGRLGLSGEFPAPGTLDLRIHNSQFAIRNWQLATRNKRQTL